jgi:hypothetical protein
MRDMTGLRFTKLVVVRLVERGRYPKWLCRCDCGTEKAVMSSNLTNKRSPTTSCGCAKRLPDLAGMRFGRLAVLSRALPLGNRTTYLCRCDCGTERPVAAHALHKGKVLSCGCLKSSQLGERTRTHGGTGTVEHRTWQRIKRRCYDPTYVSWPRYGGRGISMHGGWVDDFQAFLDHVGRRPSASHSIERIENNGNYEPGNVRWATAVEQARNKRNSVRVEINGSSKTVAEWAEVSPVKIKTIYNRLKSGWAPEAAVFAPTGSSSANAAHRVGTSSRRA